jgi:CDP-diacylglycerol--serine O-phosphatidyltransferase
MKSIYKLIRIPDLVSLLNSFLGFSAVLLSFQGRITASVALIFLATAVDGVDGFLARRMGPGPLGVNLDSLADAISFGMAPAFLAWSVFGSPFWIIGGVYLICGILRLARFNVAPKGETSFNGLPIPAAAMIISISVLFSIPVLSAFLMVILSAFMISDVPYPKCKDFRIVFFALAVVVAALLSWYSGTMSLFEWAIFSMLMVYLLYPLVRWLI